MTIRRAGFLFAACLAVAALGRGADGNAGTSGAAFLKIGAGARPTAMGSAFTGLADDVNAVYFNPAGLAFLQAPEITAMRTQWFQDMDYDFGAFAYPSARGTVALSAATLSIDGQQKRAADESLVGTFESLDAAYALSYAKTVSAWFSLGGTVRYIDQAIDTASAQTWSGDVGALVKLARWPLSFGVAAKHFGQYVEFNRESDPLPFTVDFGVGANLFGERLKIGIDARSPRDNDVQLGTGAEWNQRLSDDFRASARAGYNSAVTGANGASGLTLGGGVTFRRLTLDVAWVPFGDLGNTFRYAAHMRF